MFGLRLIRIRGHSMAPVLNHGDFALAKRLGPTGVVTVGDIVEIDHPNYGLIVKMIKKECFGNFQSHGLSVRSIELSQIGWIPRSCVAARLLLRISPTGVSCLRRGASGFKKHKSAKSRKANNHL
ncbi:MAG: hypothetical protein CMM55_04205 [Rhodospirillaceae bacterium]|nr:hypothetical protein [Rhodospirillaceae bacterium]